MTPMVFRNVYGSTADPVTSWPFEGLVEVLERGLAPDWVPVFQEVSRQPWGVVARSLDDYLAIATDHRMKALVEVSLERARAGHEKREREQVASELRDIVRRSGLSQAECAKRLGTSASRLSTYLNGQVVPQATFLVRARSLLGGEGESLS